MTIDAEPSRLRRIAAGGALLTNACVAATQAFDTYRGRTHVEWAMLVAAAGLLVASIAMVRRGILTQVFARAAAWIMAVPASLELLEMLRSGGPVHRETAVLAVSSVAALLLARPMLHTEHARAAFAPARYRKWFLAGATASAAIGMATTGLVLLVSPSDALLAAPALLLVASAFGVLRMRAWGVILGILASVATVMVSVALSGFDPISVTFGALPGALLVLPLLFARRSRARAAEPSRVRVGAAAEGSETRTVRVALDEHVVGALDADETETDTRAQCV